MCPPDDSVGGVSGQTPPIQQPKSKGGRPPGVPNTFNTKAVKRLQELKFDPIEKMVDQYDEIVKKIEDIENSPRPSQVAIAQLIAVKQKLTNDLMRYGYARAPEVNTQQVINEKPMIIVSTTPENFEKIKEPEIDETPMKGEFDDEDLT